ncbi:hypothetical protein CLOM_g22130 [Closterium sp. NIES-68]|nr:hypothetical protein CLOM_g22130 [Closterium sp. NIES-68]
MSSGVSSGMRTPGMSPAMSPAQSPAMSPRKGSTRTLRERKRGGGWGSEPASPAPTSSRPSSAAQSPSAPSPSAQPSSFSSSLSLPDESSPVVLGPRPLLRFDVPGAAGVMYDEPHGILLVSAHEKVYAWRVPTPAQEQQGLEQYIQQQQQVVVGHSQSHGHSHLQPVQQPAPQVFAISDRPVLAVRFSLDGRILAVQRSAHELELLLRRPSSSTTTAAATSSSSASASPTPTAAAAGGDGAAAAASSAAAAGQGGEQAGEGVGAGREQGPGNTGSSSGACGSSGAPGSGSASGRSRGSSAAEAAMSAPVTVTAPALTYRSRSAADKILGFFWSDCPLCDLVIVTTGGLELFRVVAAATARAPGSPSAGAAGAAGPGGSGSGAGGSGSGQVVMRVVEAWRVAIGWYVYTHESRVLILAAGPRFCTLTAIQFSAAGLVKLPKFSAQLGTPAPTTAPTHSLTAKPPPPVVLAPQDVRIANMYGRIYCIQVDRVSSLLHIFRFFRDAIVLQVSIPLPSTRVAVSVADNLLLVHLPAIHRLLLFDPLLNHWKPICPALAPTFAPLPSSSQTLPRSLSRSLSRSSTSLSSTSTSVSTASGSGDGSSAPSTPRTGTSSSSSGGGSSSSGSTRSSSSSSSGRSRSRSKVYGSGWVLVNPDLVLDHVKGVLWRLHLNLQSLAVCAADRASLFALLQRRRCNRQQVRSICLSLFSDLLASRSPLPALSSAFSSLLSTYATALAAAAQKPKPVQGSPTAAAAAVSGGAGSSTNVASSNSTVAAREQLMGQDRAGAAGAGAGAAEQRSAQQLGPSERTSSGGFFHVAADSGESGASGAAVLGGDGGMGEALEGKAGAGGGTGGGEREGALSRSSSVASVGDGQGLAAARGGSAGGGRGGEAEVADPAVEEDEGVVSADHLLQQIERYLEACTQQARRHGSTLHHHMGAGESSRGGSGEGGGDGGGGGEVKGGEDRGEDGSSGEKERDNTAACGAASQDSSYIVGVMVELIRCMDDLRLPLPAFLRAQSSLVRLLASHHMWAALLHLLNAKLLRFSPPFSWDLLRLSSSLSPSSSSPSPPALPPASLKARSRVRREAVRLLQAWLGAREGQEQGRMGAQRREDMAALLRAMVLSCGPLAAARFLASAPSQVFWQHASSLLACLSHSQHLHLAPAVLRCFQEAVPSFQDALARRERGED